MRRYRVDIKNRVFGRLTALKVVATGKKRVWRCRCVCGNYVRIPTFQLLHGLTKSCGCIRIEDLTGMKFGRLTVLKLASRKNGTTWLCRCLCGRKKAVRARHLKTGVDSCGCYTAEKLSVSRRLPHGFSARNRVIDWYRRNAKKKGLCFKLTRERVIELLGGDCFYCGAKPSSVCARRECFGSFLYNGIDRLNNSVGYIEGNVVSACWRCNMMKRDLDKDEFIKVVLMIAERHK